MGRAEARVRLFDASSLRNALIFSLPAHPSRTAEDVCYACVLSKVIVAAATDSRHQPSQHPRLANVSSVPIGLALSRFLPYQTGARLRAMARSSLLPKSSKSVPRVWAGTPLQILRIPQLNQLNWIELSHSLPTPIASWRLIYSIEYRRRRVGSFVAL